MDKILNLISIATKAGKVKTGEFLTTKTLQEGLCHLVVIATDTSEKSTKRLMGISENYECKSIVYGTKEELGKFTGKKEKSVIAITDEGLAQAIAKKYQDK
ncbi:MAG: ribosomal L7Ae/L30e/S12e/Gadd45 family protein [Clostridia bacterium]|nr:ribosomal L7Ae/L30e/S12e/Gadd45 family protein [Clostridia bacterium]